jgi:hypothetical protein
MDIWSMEMKELLWSLFPMGPLENTWIVSSLCVVLLFIHFVCVLEFLKSDWRTNAGIHSNILDLAARLDIAIDVAHAITYLHMYTGIPLVMT